MKHPHESPDHELNQPNLAYTILTQERMMMYVKFLLAWNVEGTQPPRPRFLYEYSFRQSTTNFFRRHYYCGGNPEGKELEISLPRHFLRPIHFFIKGHFDSADIQRHIRHHVKREFICRKDLENSLNANHPFSRSHASDYAMMYFSLEAGLRGGTISWLSLADITEVHVSILTHRIRVTCNFHKFKARGVGVARRKNFSGTLDDPASPIYHLHCRILELTNGEMGLIRCDSSEESMYGWKNNPAALGIVADDIENNRFKTINQYVYEKNDEQLRRTFLFARPQTNVTNNNVLLVRRRFSHYPTRLRERFVFHSLRSGFYCTTVYYFAKNNCWDWPAALNVAKFLGEWRVKVRKLTKNGLRLTHDA